MQQPEFHEGVICHVCAVLNPRYLREKFPLRLNCGMTKLIALLCLFLFSQTSLAQKIATPNKYLLWYKQPAKNWNEALPIGNGRLGAMIFGNVSDELIQMNEETLWTGGPANLNPNPNASQYLQPVRDALYKDSVGAAIELLQKMQGPNTSLYQPLGDLYIKQTLSGEATNYTRDLDISKAISTTKFTVDGVEYTREYFTSAPAQVMLVKLTATKKGALNISLGASSPLTYETTVASNKDLVLSGKLKGYLYNNDFTAAHQGCAGMRYQMRVRLLRTDGKLTTDSILHISNASEAIFIVGAATSYNGFDKCPDQNGKDEVAAVLKDLKNAEDKTFVQLLLAHIKDYQSYFNRLDFSITDEPAPLMPTDERLQQYKQGTQDPNLEELYFQFGRYLLISCSRPGGIAANLQGIWNKEIYPPWSSNYTTNINLQMNYWPAEMCNLSELTEPLIHQIKNMAANGKSTAKNYYNMKGWAAHHNSDIWAQTNPVGDSSGDPRWANWALGSPWLSQHLYEHYRFTGDKKFLQQTAYPLMKDAATFCLDWLVEKDGWLVTAPSTSPEHAYRHPNGQIMTVTIASAMDMEIIWDLFTNIIEASKALGIDAGYAKMIEAKLAKLRPLQIGKKGNLQEWYGDFEDEDPHHRHVSQLFGLHPGREISPLLDTAIANAAKTTLLVRGDGGTGWSKAWKINFWARLLDGDHAYKMYGELLKNSTMNNLFDTHPPFQIDGNFGATSGIAEMLLQSHLDAIQLLPALPAAWQTGHMIGLKARGGFTVDMWWEDGKLTRALVHSAKGGECRILTKESITVLDVPKPKKRSKANPYHVRYFETRAGKVYELRASN